MRRVAIVACVAYVTMLGLTSIFPGVFSRLVTPLVPAVTGWMDHEIKVDQVDLDGQSLVVTATSSKLFARFTVDRSIYIFKSTQSLRMLNVYPFIALVVLGAWPLRIRLKAGAALVVLLLLVIFAAIDVATMTIWSGAELFLPALRQMGDTLSTSPESAKAVDAVRDQFSRLTLLKTFFSAGGRHFLSLLAVGISLLMVYPFQPRSRTDDGARAN